MAKSLPVCNRTFHLYSTLLQCNVFATIAVVYRNKILEMDGDSIWFSCLVYLFSMLVYNFSNKKSIKAVFILFQLRKTRFASSDQKIQSRRIVFHHFNFLKSIEKHHFFYLFISQTIWQVAAVE